MKQLESHQGRSDRARRRYLTALKALAAVRKLSVPTIQVTIARHPVNVAGPGQMPAFDGDRPAAP